MATVGVDYGLPGQVSTRMVYGVRGAKWVPSFLRTIASTYWFAYQTVDGSLYTEGAEGVRVLSTRFRTRAVRSDTRQEVRAIQEQIEKLQAGIQRLQKEIAVQGEDLKYLQKLEGFTGTALSGLTEKGRLDSKRIPVKEV